MAKRTDSISAYEWLLLALDSVRASVHALPQPELACRQQVHCDCWYEGDACCDCGDDDPDDDGPDGEPILAEAA